MPALVDVWRAVDPAARLVAGDHERLRAAVRGIVRTRATAPILPLVAGGELLVVDTPSLAEMTGRELLEGIRASGGEPSGVVFANATPATAPQVGAGSLPVIVSGVAAAAFVALAREYLEREAALLERWALELRVAMAEAALAEPGPAAPASVAGRRVRRGIAVARAGRLVSVHPAAGRRRIALDFTATFARLFSEPSDRRQAERRTRSGLWLAEFPVPGTAGASLGVEGSRARSSAGRTAVWLFDDVPFGALDRLAGATLARTLQVVLAGSASAASAETRHPPRAAPGGKKAGTGLADTLMAVARCNGRIAPAARALGVHRNTVLYRLRRARDELGIDPRRADDAVRLLREGAPPES